MTITLPDIELSEELIRKFDTLGPRYTSYPTADRFNAGFTEQSNLSHLEQRAKNPGNPPLSIYVHLPFCESLCYFCACNKIITKEHGRVGRISALSRQGNGAGGCAHRHLTAKRCSCIWAAARRPSSRADELGQLMAMLRSHFDFTPDAELGVEIDPRTVGDRHAGHAGRTGF